MDDIDLINPHISWMRAGGLSANTIRDRRRLLLALDKELPFGLAWVTRPTS